MKNFKKIGVLVFTVAIMLVMLNACGQKSENKENTNSETQNSTTISNVQNTTKAQTNNATIPADYTEYTDSNTGLKFAYPSTWVNAGTDQIPVFGDSTTGATVNLVTENVTSDVDLSVYVNASKQAVKSTFEINGDLKEETTKVNGIDATKLTYSITQSNLDMTLQQVIMVKDSKAYVITFGAPSIYYNSSEDTFNKILSTIQL